LTGRRPLVACVFSSQEALSAALDALRAHGIKPGDVGVGAADNERAQSLAAQNSIATILDPSDPLHGFGGLADETATRRSVDRGGVIGAITGAVIGLALGFTSIADWMPVARPESVLALVLFTFVLGVIVGSVLGAAFAPQSSSHAGFRLIDGMHEGGITLLVVVPEGVAPDAIAQSLRAAGGTGLTRA